MPVQQTTTNGKPAYKWGDEGHAYDYEAGNEASRKAAYEKALRQGRAIELSKRKQGDSR